MQDILDQLQTNQSSLQSIQTVQYQILESLSMDAEVHQIVVGISNFQISSNIAQDRYMNWNCRKKNLNMLIDCVNENNNQNDPFFQQKKQTKRFINLVQEKNKKSIQIIFKKALKELQKKKQLTRIQIYGLFLEAIQFEQEKAISQEQEYNTLKIHKKIKQSLQKQKKQKIKQEQFQINLSQVNKKAVGQNEILTLKLKSSAEKIKLEKQSPNSFNSLFKNQIKTKNIQSSNQNTGYFKKNNEADTIFIEKKLFTFKEQSNSLKKYLPSLQQEKEYQTSQFQVNQPDQKSLTRQNDKVYKQLKQTVKNIGFKFFQYGVDASHINQEKLKKITISMIRNYLHLYKNQLIKNAHFKSFLFILFLKHKRHLDLQIIIDQNFSNQQIARCQIYQIMLIQEKIFKILQDFLIKAYKSYNNNPCCTVQQILKMLSEEWYLSY